MEKPNLTKQQRRKLEYQNDPEKSKRQSYAWRKRNPEKWRALKRASYLRNREGAIRRAKRWYSRNRVRCVALSRFRYLWREYGITREQYEALVLAHGGKCAICKKDFKSTQDRHTDHCHKTGMVRGLLCTRCNNGLGHVEKHDGKWILKALEYLKPK